MSTTYPLVIQHGFGFFPHITVWGSCFSLCTRRVRVRVRPPCRHLSPHSSQPNSSHHLSQPPRHTALITAPLITSHSSHHNSSQLHFSHLTHHTTTHHIATHHSSLLAPVFPCSTCANSRDSRPVGNGPLDGLILLNLQSGAPRQAGL